MSKVRIEVLTEPELVALRARTLTQTRWTEDGLRELGRDYQLTADEQVILDELDRIDFLLGKPPRACQ